MKQGEHGITYWEPVDDSGWSHNPVDGMIQGTPPDRRQISPGAATPQVDVYDDEIVIQGNDRLGPYQMNLNRGAARWLGVRLIEAAALQEASRDHGLGHKGAA